MAATTPSTTADFYGRRVSVPGTWKVDAGTEQISFTKSGNQNSYLKIKKIKAEECGFVAISRKALNEWGGETLHQKDMRLENIRFRTSRYAGYKWITPGLKKGIRHWCLGQEPKVAIEITVPMSDTALLKYVDQTMILQLATRKGR
jgi:hypothetical protein